MYRLSIDLAEGLAALALDCVHREFPNKISHVLNNGSDARSPRELTPAFYGCYDWHSAVHNHWLLCRLARVVPQAEFVSRAKAALRQSLNAENIRGEAGYLNGEGRQSFERPYGLAWLLQLAQELDEWDEPMARELATNLLPLEQAAVERVGTWLAKLEYPVRTGEHNQTAFSLGLIMDYARHKKNERFLDLLTAQARKFYFADKSWRFDFEPSGEDFLSPGLGEADLMRRVLPAQEFRVWLDGFLPADWGGLRPVVSPDRSDPKFSHVDGLNLSRAWMLEGIASGLPASDARGEMLRGFADGHVRAGFKAMTDEYYVGSHWLGTFVVYLLTWRGIGNTA